MAGGAIGTMADPPGAQRVVNWVFKKQGIER